MKRLNIRDFSVNDINMNVLKYLFKKMNGFLYILNK